VLKTKASTRKFARYEGKVHPDGIKNQQNMSFLTHLKLNPCTLNAITDFVKTKKSYKQVF
jgi:hypothetical protein